MEVTGAMILNQLLKGLDFIFTSTYYYLYIAVNLSTFNDPVYNQISILYP